MFSHVGYRVVLQFYQFHVLVPCLFFLVLFVSILDIRCYYFVSVLSGFSLLKNRTKWFCRLHLVVFFPFLLFCFEFCLFCFSFLSKKDPKKTGHSKNPKKQKCRKKRKNQLAQLCSQIVFLILGCGLKNADVC